MIFFRKKLKIKQVVAKEISDSKGRPTVEVLIETNFGNFSSAVASGVSTGKYEALELRDDDGLGVKKAILNIEKIITPVLIDEVSIDSQKRIDDILVGLDGTKNKARLGANAILPVSMAVCRALANYNKLQLWRYISILAEASPSSVLPKPSFNMIEGGKHSPEGSLAFQEFMLVPQKEKFTENFKIGKEVYKKLGETLKEKFGGVITLSAEGAYAPSLSGAEEAIEFIIGAVAAVGYENTFKIAIDAASSEFYQNGEYLIFGRRVSKPELTELYSQLVERYPILSIEDPYSEEDFDGFSELKNRIGDKALVIGDDLTVSNVERIKKAKERNACSGLILKPNQIGTVSEVIEAANLAKSFGWKIMVSNRAGETMDDFIADLVMGVGAEFIKSGAPFPKERLVKYDRLVKIEEEILGV